MATTKSTTADTAPAAAPSADDLKSEQDKGGKDPVGKSKDPEKVKTIEEEGIGSRDPYPTGNPPAPEAEEPAP